jgi:hypothetical protein
MLAYEELKGSSGREVWYRPPRYEGRRLFPNLPPRVRAKSNLYLIHNISLSGVAAIAKHTPSDALEVGEVVPLSIQQRGLPIFESEARVCRAENTVFGSKVAFNYLDRFIEFDKFHRRNAQAQRATRAMLISPEQGAGQLVWLAQARPGTDWTSGTYYEKRSPARRVNRQALDDDLARRLWDRSAHLLG